MISETHTYDHSLNIAVDVKTIRQMISDCVENWIQTWICCMVYMDIKLGDVVEFCVLVFNRLTDRCYGKHIYF